MQRISLCDLLLLSTQKNRIDYFGPTLTADPDQNLCVKAARAFQTAFGEQYGCAIELNKNIPIGAGLGGGSSDAASVLFGMARLYRSEELNSIPERQKIIKILMNLAKKIGSDVPFFLSGAFDGHFNTEKRPYAALAQGRGEILNRHSGLSPETQILVIYPSIEISTAWAYGNVDRFLTFDENDIKLANRSFLEFTGDIPSECMGNDFEKPVFESYPELAHARDHLLRVGARFAELSGSGSSLFGLFDGEAAIRDVQHDLPAVELRGVPQTWLSFVCRPF